MRVFSALYDKTMRLSRDPRAVWYLGGLSVAESSFFPIPPDVMLAPMSLARPDRALGFAALTTLASVVGGVIGYLIGLLAFDLVEPLIHDFGYVEAFQRTQDWFGRWGFWAIFVAGFSPIPYKIFTISAGVLAMAFLPFVLASVIGRGARFFLVAGLMAWGGAPMERELRKWVDTLGWLVVAAIVVFIVIANSSS